MRPSLFLKKLRAIYSYKKNSIIGNNIQFFPSARCYNQTDEKGNIRIGHNSRLMGSVQAFGEGKIEIGDNFYMGQSSLIGSAESITIGRCVIISNDVHIYDNTNHPTAPKARERMSMEGFSNDNWSWRWAKTAPVVIEDNVWIGQYATILKGVTIGKGSIVGTQAVVTKNIPPYSVAVGNPARVVKTLNPDADIIK